MTGEREPERRLPQPAPDPPIGTGNGPADRTRLAWRRTTLITTLVVLLIGRLAIHDGLAAFPALCLSAALGAWLAVIWLARRRIQAASRRAPASAGRTLPAMALSTIALAAIGIVLVLVGGLPR